MKWVAARAAGGKRGMNTIWRFLLPIAVLATTPATAQELDEQGEEIVVVASGREFRATDKELRAAVRAFEKDRRRYAPDSKLLFVVSARDPSVSLDGFELTFAGEDESVSVWLGPDHRFELPDLPDERWRLLSNRQGVAIRLQALVVSPGTSPGDWRFGDLQLQCRVGWAIARQSTSLAAIALLDAMGACTSPMLVMYEDFGRPIEEAYVVEGAKRADLSIFQSTQYRFPTYLKGYGPEARVRVISSE